MPLEMVSWLCLHDLRTVEEETNPNAMPSDFVGLKYKNGTEKAIWSYWQALYAIPSVPEFPLPTILLAFMTIIPLFVIALVKKQFQKRERSNRDFALSAKKLLI